MTQEGYARIKEVFQQAVELPDEQRAAFLDLQDLTPEQRSQVDELLRHDAAPLELPDPVVGRDALEEAWTSEAPLPEVPGYEVEGLIGEGGMGEVYLARQKFPPRRVALKLIRGARFSEQTLRRFREEIELLGGLQHPGITQVYEADPTGKQHRTRPFFAMEYIDGLPLTEYAERNGLGRDDRLRLIVAVARAVHYAHERGIIHRDLKPRNVLVDANGQPKILDFGIARAVGDQFETRSLLTDSDQVVGTMGYMAPEQFQGRCDQVGRQVDVYALGTLLFELLTGKLPHELDGLNLFAAGERITKTEATRISRVVRAHRGDLETIVRKALERDPAVRYATAADLADDLERYLNGEPIRARPPSVIYRTTKFLRRHRRPTGAAAFSLAVGLVVGGWYFFRTEFLYRPNEEAAPFVAGEVAELQLNGTAPEGRFGSEVFGPGDLDGDGRPDLVVGAPSEPHEDRLGLGSVTAFSGAALDGAPLWKARGIDEHGWFGHRVVSTGDCDGDGAPDLWVLDGHQYHDQDGRLTLLSGRTGDRLLSLTGRELGACFRRNLAVVQDRNEDGMPDLVIACVGRPAEGQPLKQEIGPAFPRPGAGRALEGHGALLFLSGRDGTVLQRHDEEQTRPGFRFPLKVEELDDYTGDGVPEIGATAPHGSSPGMQANGLVAIYDGASLERRAVLAGPVNLASFGRSLALVDDLDGDGLRDLAVGAHNDAARGTGSGSVTLFASGSGWERWALIPGPHFDAHFGISVCSAFDLNGDGVEEVAIGASTLQHVHQYAGAVFVYDVSERDLPRPLYETFGDYPNAGLGYPVRMLPDLDGDGRRELAAGAALNARYRARGGSARLVSSRWLTAHQAEVLR